MSKTIDLSKVSSAELEAALVEKKASEKKAQKERKEKYERDRNDLVIELITRAIDVNDILTAFKAESFKHLHAWLERMREYGSAKEEQENFQLVSADGNLKVKFTLNITKGFDERSKLAEAKLKEFLTRFMKKRDIVAYNFIMGILERNTITGELDVNNVNKLYTMENDFADEAWLEAIKLFKESYVERTSKYYASFYKKNENNGWDAIKLDYAAV